jgi:hypothetical protein
VKKIIAATIAALAIGGAVALTATTASAADPSGMYGQFALNSPADPNPSWQGVDEQATPGETTGAVTLTVAQDSLNPGYNVIEGTATITLHYGKWLTLAPTSGGDYTCSAYSCTIPDVHNSDKSILIGAFTISKHAYGKVPVTADITLVSSDGTTTYSASTTQNYLLPAKTVPTTTTTVPTTTNNGGAGSTSTSVTNVNSGNTSNSTVNNNGSTGSTAQVTAVPTGAPETGGGATAGLQDEWLLILAAGLIIAGAGGLVALKRRGTRVTQ